MELIQYAMSGLLAAAAVAMSIAGIEFRVPSTYKSPRRKWICQLLVLPLSVRISVSSHFVCLKGFQALLGL